MSYDTQSFHDGLVAHGLIVPVGVPGAFGRGAVFEDVLDRFNALVSLVGADDCAEFVTFPPIIDRRVLEKVRYVESFPHLCGVVHSFFGDAIQALALAERASSGADWGDMLCQTGVVLNPACCYPLYPTLSGTLPASGRTVSLLGWAYRHEPSTDPTRMQSFRVREFIRAGSAEQVLEWRDLWLQRGIDLLVSLGLRTQTDIAADPFFGRRGKLLGASQRELKLKFEVSAPIVSVEALTALCSFNYHQDRFGTDFDIRTVDGRVAHTACLGFGMERVTMALFRAHGFVPDLWPTEVRKLLWPRVRRDRET